MKRLVLSATLLLLLFIANPCAMARPRAARKPSPVPRQSATPAVERSLALQEGGLRYFAPGKPPRINVYGQNVAEASLEVWRLPTLPTLEAARAYAVRPPSRRVAVRFFAKQPTHEFYVQKQITLPIRDEGVYFVRLRGAGAKSTNKTTSEMLVCVTRLYLVTKLGPGQMLVYAGDATRGVPMDAVDVTLYRAETPGHMRRIAAARTRADGTASLRIGKDAASYVVVAHRGNDFNRNDAAYQPPPLYRVYVYTDRPVYRPGHTVSYKAIVRRLIPGTNRYENLPDRAVNVEVRDSVGSLLARQTLTSTPAGTVSGQYTIAAEPPLGQYALSVEVDGQQSYGAFKVEEYRKPDFTVAVTPRAPYTLSGHAVEFDVAARYFFNSAVAGARFTWTASVKPYQPPAIPGADFDESYLSEPGVGEGRVVEPTPGTPELHGEGKLDADGHAHLSVATSLEAKNYAVTMAVDVTDAGNRVESGSADEPVTAASIYLDARPDRRIYAGGETVKIAVRARGFDGKPKAAPVRVLLGNSVYNNGKEMFVVAAQGSGHTDAAGNAVVALRAPSGGQYVARVQGTDEHGRTCETETAVWVASAARELAANRWPDLKIVTDRSMMRPGEIARILVLTSAQQGSVLLTLEGDRLHRYMVLPVHDHMALASFPVTSDMLPTLHLGAALIDAKGKSFLDTASIGVRADENFLEVRVTPDKKEYKPGEKGSVVIGTYDARGHPVPAEVSLGVVDEAIYQISPDLSQPIRRFYWGYRDNQITTVHSDTLVYSAGQYQRVGGDTKIRRVFLDTANWTPAVTTGEDGQARVDFEYPDNLTTWRITSVGVTADTRVGRAVDKTVVRKPFMLRVETPRFAVRDDRTEVMTFVHNETGAAQHVEVSLQAKNLQLRGPAKQVVDVPAGQMSTQHWPVTHPDSQDATVTAVATTQTPGVDDGVEGGMRGVPWGLPQVSREAGVLAPGGSASASLSMPSSFDPDAGGLTLRLSPGVAGVVGGSAAWLADQATATSEQVVSSFLPLAVAATVDRQLGIPLPMAHDKLVKRVQDSIATLYGWQKNDGGWAWVTDGQPYTRSDLYATTWVVEGLGAAREAGYLVDETRLARARTYLDNAYAHLDNPGQRALVLYALSSQSGQASVEQLDALLAKQSTLDYYAQAALVIALARSGQSEKAARAAAVLASGVHDEDGQAHWETEPEKYDWTNDTVEATAMGLRALLLAAPDSPLVDRVARWLVLRRSGVNWSNNTRTTALAVVALAEWMRARKDAGGTLQVTAALNGQPAGQWTVSTASTDALPDTARGSVAGGPEVVVHLSADKLKAGANTVTLSSSGSGHLFWYADTAAYPQSTEPVAARDGGLAIHREYYKRIFNYDTNGNMSYRYETINGPVKVGDEVLVILKMASWVNADYLTMEDPIPAGFDVYDQEPTDLYPKGYVRDYISRVFHRDQKVVFYQDHATPRVYQYMYLMRAVTPGRYGINPGQIRLFYYPNVEGHTASRLMEVVP